MALVVSLQVPIKRKPTIRVARPYPECLNWLTSLGADSCRSDRVPPMIAGQTASQITAGTATNDYL
jgi:hypothetical protein